MSDSKRIGYVLYGMLLATVMLCLGKTDNKELIDVMSGKELIQLFTSEEINKNSENIDDMINENNVNGVMLKIEDEEELSVEIIEDIKYDACEIKATLKNDNSNMIDIGKEVLRCSEEKILLDIELIEVSDEIVPLGINDEMYANVSDEITEDMEALKTETIFDVNNITVGSDKMSLIKIEDSMEEENGEIPVISDNTNTLNEEVYLENETEESPLGLAEDVETLEEGESSVTEIQKELGEGLGTEVTVFKKTMKNGEIVVEEYNFVK